MEKKTAKKVARRAAKISPNETVGTPHPVAPSPVPAKPEIKKIQGLLTSKTADGVTLGLSLLESLNATRADYEAVFTERVIKSILGGWVAESWGGVAKALLPHGAVSDAFQRFAEEKYLKRPRRLADFRGLIHARLPVARVAFLAARGQGADPEKPFLDLVDIRTGSFTMGSPENEAGRGVDENQVQVRITKPFQMGRTVVAKRQWREVMGTEPWGVHDDFGAVDVTWDDAVLFCQTLTDLEREKGRLTATQSYRLPTEAEWEYACRAGTTTAFSFGDNEVMELDEDLGFYRLANEYDPEPYEKKPNPWGLLNMWNQGEWCGDWYDDTLAGGDDPVGPAAGVLRVYRGGPWHNDARYCRSASRRYDDPTFYFVRRRFRVVVLR